MARLWLPSSSAFISRVEFNFSFDISEKKKKGWDDIIKLDLIFREFQRLMMRNSAARSAENPSDSFVSVWHGGQVPIYSSERSLEKGLRGWQLMWGNFEGYDDIWRDDS